jgi:LmbE family N-acetylglucosaminyl deacetylase
VVFLTSGELGLKHLLKEEAWQVREAEARKAARILGLSEVHFLRGPDWSLLEEVAREELAQRLAPILNQEKPGLIYMPHPDDGHPDHRAVWPLLKVALQQSAYGRPEIRAYEVWTPLAKVDYVTNITEEMPKKMQALRAHRSQLGEFDYVRALRGLNQYRGALFGKCPFAEVFQDYSDQS